jgi:gamma-glutamyltranspeptidase/glutathione hydrolase
LRETHTQTDNVIKRTPGVVKYGNKTVYSTVAPSSGTVALAVLATMGLYSDTSSAGVNLTTHRLIEATRYGYGIRTELADPDFVKNVTAIEKRALSEQGAKERREAISDTAT